MKTQLDIRGGETTIVAPPKEKQKTREKRGIPTDNPNTHEKVKPKA